MQGRGAKMSPMLDRQGSPFSRFITAILTAFLVVLCVTASVCPVCLSQDLLPSQQAVPHGMDHHRNAPDCDRDGCSFCGFQFLTTTHQTILGADELISAAPPLFLVLSPIDQAFDFYHPPRA